MHIKTLRLFNFRNYERLKVDFSENLNVIYGNNAQGKTNILEAIFLCSAGRSHRTSKDSELIKVDNNGYFIKVELEKSAADMGIEVSYDTEKKKRIKINDIPATKLGSLIGNLNTVMFSPEDMLIIKEGPSERRRFIDITLSQLKPSYFFDLQQYIKVLAQKNTLLKEMQNKKHLADTLDVWNENLVKIGSRIIRARYGFIEKLRERVEINHSRITKGKEKLLLKYAPSIDGEDFSTIELIEEKFRKTLQAALSREIIKGTSIYGPQRDDYEMFLNGMNLKLYGSQGQQRTAILSIKLSEIDIMKEETGENPVLLLDDVMSELDKHRQVFLFDSVKDVQTFVTCTDKDFFVEKLGKQSRFFHVEMGQIITEI